GRPASTTWPSPKATANSSGPLPVPDRPTTPASLTSSRVPGSRRHSVGTAPGGSRPRRHLLTPRLRRREPSPRFAVRTRTHLRSKALTTLEAGPVRSETFTFQGSHRESAIWSQDATELPVYPISCKSQLAGMSAAAQLESGHGGGDRCELS